MKSQCSVNSRSVQSDRDDHDRDRLDGGVISAPERHSAADRAADEVATSTRLFTGAEFMVTASDRAGVEARPGHARRSREDLVLGGSARFYRVLPGSFSKFGDAVE